MANCTYCERELSLLERVTTMKTHRCKQCDEQLNAKIASWWQHIEMLFAGNGIDSAEEQAFYQAITSNRIPQDLGQPLIDRMRYLRSLSEIRYGNLPILRTSIHLDSDEHAHFEISATYIKPNKTPKPLKGRLIGTNKKCYFLGDQSHTLDWNNVSEVRQQAINLYIPAPKSSNRPGQSLRMSGIHLLVSKGSGGGDYGVQDPLYTKTIIDTSVRLWKRQLVLYKENKTSGSIPDHVKAAVFQRDHGRCVQCGYEGEYIEYDHIIPRSKGGPNTVENIQLLCRKCNLAKSDRI
jgi:Restriction endonuclease